MRSSLRELPLHEDAVVHEVRLLPELAEWLSAVGLEPGVRVRVLRRGVLGGPLHVRTGDDGEFAVARSVAASIVVTRGG